MVQTALGLELVCGCCWILYLRAPVAHLDLTSLLQVMQTAWVSLPGCCWVLHAWAPITHLHLTSLLQVIQTAWVGAAPCMLLGSACVGPCHPPSLTRPLQAPPWGPITLGKL